MYFTFEYSHNKLPAMKSFLFCMIFFAGHAFGQVKFVEEQTWEQISRKARKGKKLVFLHFENNKCQQCYEVAAMGLGSSILTEKFAVNFLSMKVNMETESGKVISDRFGILGAPVALFLDADGNVLNRFNGSTSAPFTYAEQADVALSRRGKKQLSAYVKEYNEGERSPQFLEEYLKKVKEALLPADDLLDEYVAALPVDSLQTFRTVRFIYNMGPALDGKAYNSIEASTPRALIDSMYRSIPFPEAVAINDAIMANTFRRAVQSKNNNLAEKMATFSERTHFPDQAKGRNARLRTMVRYYYAVRDTMQYVGAASGFLNSVHMQLSADSLKRMDEKEMRVRSFPKQQAGKPQDYAAMTKFAPSSQFYHIELNEHAWHFYEMSAQPEVLEMALQWSERSMKLFAQLSKGKMPDEHLQNASYLDTYAHILYKMGRKAEALEWQTKAVEAQKLKGVASGSFENTLNKMKAGTLLD